jgi:hypothetical protein
MLAEVSPLGSTAAAQNRAGSAEMSWSERAAVDAAWLSGSEKDLVNASAIAVHVGIDRSVRCLIELALLCLLTVLHQRGRHAGRGNCGHPVLRSQWRSDAKAGQIYRLCRTNRLPAARFLIS